MDRLKMRLSMALQGHEAATLALCLCCPVSMTINRRFFGGSTRYAPSHTCFTKWTSQLNKDTLRSAGRVHADPVIPCCFNAAPCDRDRLASLQRCGTGRERCHSHAKRYYWEGRTHLLIRCQLADERGGLRVFSQRHLFATDRSASGRERYGPSLWSQVRMVSPFALLRTGDNWCIFVLLRGDAPWSF